MVAAKGDNHRAAAPLTRLLYHLNRFRYGLFGLAGALLAATTILYFFAPAVFAFFQRYLDQKLAFFTVAEPFLAHLKMAMAMAAFLLMPIILGVIWTILGKVFTLTRGAIVAFTLATALLFYSGCAFCFFITLPYGINFLLGFGSAQLAPVISIGKFVTFLGIFILAFGTIFELPVLMIFAAKIGLCPRSSFVKHRRYAILIISIMAALLTPTPDIFNMALMGGPLYLLYESGIVTLKLLGYE